MLCDVCHKNPATVHLTEIVDDQMSELHLCEDCARQKSAQMDSQFGLSDLLAGIADFGKPAAEKDGGVAKCPKCGLTYADFKKVGRLGCGECYVAFKKYLAPLLKKIHGSAQHLGKSPAKVTPVVQDKIDLRDLRIKLQMAVEQEDFEEAARLRDRIKEMEPKQAPGEQSG